MQMKTKLIILALTLAVAGMQSAPAQTFKKVKVALNAPIAQVSSGGISVWALGSNGHPYVLSGKTLVLANSITLSQIAVGGGNAFQADAVWALNSSGAIFRASKSAGVWTFTQVPGVLDLIQVGPGYHDSCHPYEVWGLNASAQIYRYNYCTGNFDQEPGILCDIHVGGNEEIWGAQCGPNVYRFNFGSGSFDQITDPFGAFPVLAVGTTGVWAIDTSNSVVYQYDPFAATFEAVIGCCSQQIQAGGDGVWILAGGQILRYDPTSLLFADVPGSLVSISVGNGGGVWGVNGAHQVFAFSTP
jgi:hypothetical protein